MSFATCVETKQLPTFPSSRWPILTPATIIELSLLRWKEWPRSRKMMEEGKVVDGESELSEDVMKDS